MIRSSAVVSHKEKAIAAGGVPIIEGVWHGSRILSWLIKPVKLFQGAWHRHKAD